MMLVLTRKEGESVTITCADKVINVKISYIRGKQASIGFKADKDVVIVRDEIIGKIKEK